MGSSQTFVVNGEFFMCLEDGIYQECILQHFTFDLGPISSLKVSFNNVKSEMHCPTCYQCLWYGVILKKKKLRFKMIKKWLKKVKIFAWPDSPYSFSPIDWSVMKTVWQTQNLVSISNHKYIDNQTGYRLVKVMGFLTDLKVYISLQHELNPGFCFRIWDKVIRSL